MAKVTVYIPVEITTKEEISTQTATEIADAIVSQIKDGFYNSDNVYDAAGERLSDTDGFSFKVKYSEPPESFVASAE